MTFSETIDALVKLYSKGMRAKRYREIEELIIDDGICLAGDTSLKTLSYYGPFIKYKPAGVMILIIGLSLHHA